MSLPSTQDQPHALAIAAEEKTAEIKKRPIFISSTLRPVQSALASLARSPRRGELLIFVLALGMRLLYLHQSRANPTFAAPTLDALKYHEIAADFAHGRGFSEGFFLQSFFYPFYLGLVYRFLGVSITLAKLLQALLGAGNCVLTARLGRLAFGDRPGLLAGLLAASYAPLFYYDLELLGAIWTVFWGLALLLAFLRLPARPAWWSFAILGLLGAAATLTQPIFLPFFLLASTEAAARLVRSGFPWQRLCAGAALAFLGFAVLTAPVAWLTQRQTGRATFLPGYGSMNFYLGNNPDAFHTMAARPGVAWDRLRELPLRHGATTPAEIDRFYTSEVWRYAAAQPLGFIKGLGMKTLELISSRETPNSENLYLARPWSPLLRALAWKAGGFGFPAGVLLPLALAGAFYRRHALPRPMLIFLLTLSGAIILTHVCARYRLPLVPPLLTLAAAALCDMAADLARRRWRRPLALAGCGVALLPLLAHPGPFPKESLVRYDAEMERYLSYHATQIGCPGEALRHARAALVLDPANPDLKMDLGAALLDVGERDAALHAYRDALAQTPGYGKLLLNIGLVLEGKGEAGQAGDYYRRAVAAAPWLEPAQLALGRWEALRGHLGAAEERFFAALRLNPRSAAAHAELGRLLTRSGKVAEGTVHLRQAFELDPDSQTALYYFKQIDRR